MGRTMLILYLALFPVTRAWIPCGTPRTCFCSPENGIVDCRGADISVWPNFQRITYRTTLSLRIISTSLSRLNRLNLTLWTSLNELYVLENSFLVSCQEEFNRLKNEKNDINIFMPCPQTPFSTIIPDSTTQDNSVTYETTQMSNITSRATTETTTVHSVDSGVSVVYWAIPCIILMIILVIAGILLIKRMRHTKVLVIESPIYLPTTTQ